MDKKELLQKFHSVYNEAINSQDKEDVKITLCMFQVSVEMLAEQDLRSAKELVERYEGTLKYYNFLTETEAEKILEEFINQDGSKGPRWRDSVTFFEKVEAMGGKIECEPYYNKYALWVTMNKFFSDQDNVIRRWTGDNKEQYFEACYELAVSQLKDKDRPYWVRWYFHVTDKM